MKHGLPSGEHGFTVTEVLVTIIIMGILAAIAMPFWWRVVEARQVDSAANQLAGDLRLAHSSANNQFARWQVVLYPNRAAEDAGADYSLFKLDAAGNNIASSELRRTFPGSALLNTPNLLPLGGTRAVRFASDGSASAVGTLDLSVADGCPASTPANGPRIRVTVDNDPMYCVTFNAATSRIRVD